MKNRIKWEKKEADWNEERKIRVREAKQKRWVRGLKYENRENKKMLKLGKMLLKEKKESKWNSAHLQ